MALAVLVYLSTSAGRSLTRSLLRQARRIKAFGVELELAGEDEAQRLKVDFEESFRSYRADVALEFDRQVKSYDVARLHAQVAEEVIEPMVGTGFKYRSTVYVQDIVFENVLYSLLDYYPGGRGRGNAYSTRFGIIGRSWRRGRSEPPQEVPDDRVELITTWGMTREEAAAQSSAKWYTTFLLKEEDPGPATGLLFVEADNEIDARLPEKLGEAPSVATLTEGVCKVMESMRGKGPYLELFR